MPDFDAGTLEPWSPSLFPYDAPGASGQCRFAPNCGGGIQYGVGPDGEAKRTRADFPSCPEAPAEFAEAVGMDEIGADQREAGSTPADKRYVALCRRRAERRFGARALRETEATR